MQAFHLLGPAPFYTNSFLLISDAGHAVIIDPAAEVQEYDKILKEHNAQLTTILCTHGHYDHVGSAGALRREHKARLYCEPVDCRGTQLLPLKTADVDSGYEEGETIAVDELQVHGLAHPRPHRGRRGAALRRVPLCRGHGLSGQHGPHRPGGRR